jgi:hypothetical protein
MRLERAPIDDAMIERYVEFAAPEYPSGPMIDTRHLHWKYLENPNGVAFADHVWDGSVLVGRVVYVPWKFRSGSSVIRAVLLVDLLVDREYRPKGVFLRLMAHLLDVPDCDLVYLVPNDVSAPLYEKMLRIEPLQHLELHGFPLRLDRLAASVRPSLRGLVAWLVAPWRRAVALWARPGRSPEFVVTSAYPGDDAVDALAASLPSTDVVMGDRSAAFHRWRFAADLFPYDCRYVLRGDRLVGYCVTRMAEVEGLEAFLIVDLVCAPTAGASAARALLRDAFARAVTEDADLVASMSTGDTALTRWLRRPPLLRVPTRFSPQTAPLMARAPTSVPAVEHTAAGDRYALSLADLDVF